MIKNLTTKESSNENNSIETYDCCRRYCDVSIWIIPNSRLRRAVFGIREIKDRNYYR